MNATDINRPSSPNMGLILGIDLGTTNSVAAYMKDGRPVVLPNLEGDDLTPSVVAFTGGGRRCVGQPARAQTPVRAGATTLAVSQRMDASPTGPSEQLTVVSSIKRRMGESYTIQIDGRSFTPVEISAMILAKVKNDAEAHLGLPIDRAVITVPAYFNDAQRRATKDAAGLAGLEVVRLVNEPTAAALAYGLDIEEAHTILVWDLGGGTFDVSVLELGDGVFQVRAVNGNTHLGGDDYDTRLAEILAEGLRRQWGIDPGDDPATGLLLRRLAEETKITLSTQAEVRVEFPLCFAPGNRCHLTVTRDAFEQATADLTERMVAPACQVLADAGLDSLDLDRVILVGGMTRMPAVRALVKKLTGLEPYAHIDPDKVVALGAAVQAGVLAGLTRKVTLVDVTPLSLGIESQGGLFARIIHRNTPIPASRSKLFTNAFDNQASIEVHVLQGEREMAADNMPLGYFELSDLTPQPRGQARIEVSFDIDANGIVQVSATDLQTDQSRRIRLEAAGRLADQDVQRVLTESRQRQELDRRKREAVVAGIRARNLLRAARGFLDKVPPADTRPGVGEILRAIEAAVSGIETALADETCHDIQAASESLEALLKRLTAALKEIRGQTPDSLGKTGPFARPPAGNPVSVPEFPQRDACVARSAS